MNVSILARTPDPMFIVWTAARTCQSEDAPQELIKEAYEKDRRRLMKDLWRAGHYSVFEHVNVTYAISGISRACLAQMSRHRFLSMSVQSQRHVDLLQAYDGPRLSGVIPESISSDPVALSDFQAAWSSIEHTCDRLLGAGFPKEDVRYLYPEGTTTNLVLTANLRTLGELNEKRAQNKAAQWEIRELTQRMIDLAVADIPWFGECLGGREKDENQDQASTGNEAV